MNGKIKRYNLTVQQKFVDWQLDDLDYDIGNFNYQLMDWLLWYNTVRPHHTLKLKSPLKALLDAARDSSKLCVNYPGIYVNASERLARLLLV